MTSPLARPALPASRTAALLLAALLLAAACAKMSDVERVEQQNRVQDQRLRALEEGVSDALRAQFDKLSADLADLRRVVEGRTANINERLDELAAEQKKIAQTAETSQLQVRRMERRLEDQTKSFAAYRAEAENDLDKLRLRLRDLENLLKSPIAGLPASTEPDKVFRDAYFLLISGQLDLAVDRFGQFMQQFPKEPRRAEALFRQGQAYFLLRKYDFALVPLFEILDKHGQSKFVIEARWLLARSLEETGDLKLARDFYAQLIAGKTVYSADASRRVAFMNRVLPAAEPQKPDPSKPEAPRPEAQKPEPPKPPAGGAVKPEAQDKAGKAEAETKS